MLGAYRWDGSFHDRMWRVASWIIGQFGRLPGCYNLAGRIDVWRVEHF